MTSPVAVPEEPIVAQWRELDIELTGAHTVANPYVDIAFDVSFTHESGTVLSRPAFWDGGTTWRVRFAPTTPGRWTWVVDHNAATAGLTGRSGRFTCEAAPDDEPNAFYRHGFWRMSPAGRSLIHADDRPAILVGDTAWGLPWRATNEHVHVYAADRARKGFNAVLLMTVQPDMDAVGPRDRTLDEGFGVAFEDLPRGHINDLNVDYFQHLDGLLSTLADAGIASVLQPVFHGFGWKGLRTAGPFLEPEEYARYCRYLVARYGARPVLYLVGADGAGDEPSIAAGGEAVEASDCYKQPTGIHYRPHGWNCAYQDATWLDFQWCQTGHGGEHIPERVADMAKNLPVRAIANGEPSYERQRDPNTPGSRGNAEGWWQGHEAWSNLFAGGTMGVVYGAASMWQWRLHPNEPGHEPYFLTHHAGWREALDFEGSTYVGLVSRILEGLPTTDMRPNWTLAICPRVLEVPGRLVMAYQEHGGDLKLMSPDVPRAYRIVDPRTGTTVSTGVRTSDVIADPDNQPRLYIFQPE